MTELKELLEGQVAQQPHDSGDAQAAIRAGRRKLQTRRAIAGGGAVLASAVAGALVVSLVQAGPGTTPAAGPAKGPELSLADAKPAVEGVDYDVLDHNVLSKTDQPDLPSIIYRGFTSDGLGYAAKDSQPLLIDPRTHKKDLIPKPPGNWSGGLFWEPLDYVGTDRIVRITEGEKEETLSFGETEPPGLKAVAFTYDRDARSWSTQTWTGLPEDGYIASVVVGTDNRIYLAVGVEVARGDMKDPTTFDVWSVGVGDPSDVRDENLTVGSLTGVGTSLVWTDPPGTASPKIHLRNLADGAESTIDDRAGCLPTVARSSDDELVLAQFACEDDAKDQVAVYTATGDHVASVVGKDAEVGGVNDTHLLAYDSDGTYTLDLDSKELLKVSDASTDDRAPESSQLSGSMVFWDAPTRDGSTDQTVAEMK